MTAIILTLIGVAIVVLAIFLLKTRKSSDQSPIEKAATDMGAAVPDPEKEYRQIMDSLLSLNILIRKDRSLAPGLLKKLEPIIDDLMVVIPQMMDRYPSETLTYEIKKIGQAHLFKTVKEFLDLSEDSRSTQLDIFTKTIDSLHEVSNRSRTIVEKNETAEFKTMANFLSTKFS